MKTNQVSYTAIYGWAFLHYIMDKSDNLNMESFISSEMFDLAKYVDGLAIYNKDAYTLIRFFNKNGEDNTETLLEIEYQYGKLDKELSLDNLIEEEYLHGDCVLSIDITNLPFNN